MRARWSSTWKSPSPLLPTWWTKRGDVSESVLERDRGPCSIAPGAAQHGAEDGLAGPPSLCSQLACFWPRAVLADSLSSEWLLSYMRDTQRRACTGEVLGVKKSNWVRGSICPDQKNFHHERKEGAVRLLKPNFSCYKCLKGLQNGFQFFITHLGEHGSFSMVTMKG